MSKESWNSPATLEGIMGVFRRGSAGVFVLRLGALLAALVTHIALTRALGQSGFGLLAIGIAWLAILQVIASLGMNLALVRFIPQMLAKEGPHVVRRLISWAGGKMAMGGIVVGALFAAGVAVSPTSPELKGVLLMVAAMVPLQTLNLHCLGTLQGMKRPVQSLFPTQLGVFLGILAGIFILHLTGRNLTPLMASGLWLGSLAMALILSTLWRLKATPRISTAPLPAMKRKSVFSTSLALGGLVLAGLLVHQADPAMLGFLATPEDAALYSVANRAGSLVLFGLVAVNAIAAPLISQLHTEGRMEELQALLGLAAKGILLYTIPATLFLVFCAPFYLPFFGPGFEAARAPLVWLVLAQCINALAGSVGFLLTMTGHHGIAFKVLGYAAILKIISNFILIPRWGAEGAAWGSAAMLVFWNIWMRIEVRRRLGLEPSILAVFSQKPARLPGSN